jgi:hypothetical protein
MVPAVALVLFSAGCYTQLYRPDMEGVRQRQEARIYNRYDSTAIDTTLRADTSVYQQDYRYLDSYGWNTWGRPRGYTRWGFDFDRFDPSYYWSYYGYYDYYSRPWWDTWYDPYWGWGNYGGGSSGGSGEPAGRRPGGGRDRNGGTGTGGGTYVAPPAAGNPSYAAPASPPPAKNPSGEAVKDPPKNNNNGNSDTPKKPGGGRGR